jgi:peptidoglycan-associated lipoprotein
MSYSHVSRILFTGFVCAAFVCAGCRSKGSKAIGSGGLDEGLDPLGTGTDISMGADRFGEGVRITDVSFEAVYFAYDSYQVNDAETAKIQKVADYMRSNPDVRAVTEGHCDERGSREYNMSLGEHRALAVRAALVGLGIDGARIQTRSFGEEQPVDQGHDEAAWSKNRRVEFALFK